LALIIVTLTESPAVANDRVASAKWTSPRQEVQGDHPGSMLSFVSGSAIKRITASVKAAADRSRQASICWPGLHPPGKSQFPTKKEYRLLRVRR